MPPRAEARRRETWRSQPVVWLGIAIFIASIAGCLWLIVAGARYDDAPIEASRSIFGVPSQPPTTGQRR